MQAQAPHTRPVFIGRLLWRQIENLRIVKNVFHDDLQDEPDGRRRLQVKAHIRAMLDLVEDGLAAARREIDLYEPRYYDPFGARWRPLTVEAKRQRDELAARQAEVWAGARRRRMEERRHAEQHAQGPEEQGSEGADKGETQVDVNS